MILLVVNNLSCCCRWVTQSFLTLWDPMDCSMQTLLSFTISRSLLKLMFIKSVMPSTHLILSSLSPALNLSQHQSLSMSQLFASRGQSIGASFQWLFRVSLSQIHPSLWLLPPCHLHQRRSLLSSLGCDVLERMAEWKVPGGSLRICPEVNVLLKILDAPS